ncbi:MAG: Hpt domain-containing protein, partial [Syntrophorhabdus sp.]
MIKDIHVQAFIEEAFELLSQLETTLLELEENPGDAELIGQAFRALHTIKGSGAMFGFEDVARFTHTIESTFDMVREGKLEINKELISLTLAAKDLIRLMIESPDDPSLPLAARSILDSLNSAVHTRTGTAAGEDRSHKGKDNLPVSPGTLRTFRIRFQPEPGIFLTGTNPILLLNELASLGECSIFAGLDEIPPIDHINPELCYVFWDIILTTDNGIDPIKDVFIFIEDQSEIAITLIDDGTSDTRTHKMLGEILVERKDIDNADLSKLLAEKKKLGEILVETGLVSQERVESALREQVELGKIKKATANDQAMS